MTFESEYMQGIQDDVKCCVLFVNEQYALAKRLGVKDLGMVVYPDIKGYRRMFKMLYGPKSQLDPKLVDEMIAKAVSEVERDGSC